MTEVLSDERGVVEAWQSEPCDCDCHDEPMGDVVGELVANAAFAVDELRAALADALERAGLTSLERGVLHRARNAAETLLLALDPDLYCPRCGVSIDTYTCPQCGVVACGPCQTKLHPAPTPPASEPEQDITF